jgi:hypothetical protein
MMSSVIARQPKDTKKQTTVSLSGTVLADLELYCQFIDSARDWVINEALKTVFRRDKAFLVWKQRNDAGVAETEDGAARPSAGPVQLPLPAGSRPERSQPHRVRAPEPPSAA